MPYVTDERRPDFIVGKAFLKGWMQSDRFRAHYLPFAQGRVSGAVRRDLLLVPKWRQARGKGVHYKGGLRLVGVRAPSRQVHRALYVEVGISAPPGTDTAFGLTAWLADDQGQEAIRWPLDMRDDIAPVAAWGTDTFVGRYALPVHTGVRPGRYTLGFTVTGPRGRTLQPDVPAELPGTIEVVGARRIEAEATSDLSRSEGLARDGQCAAAWRAWREAAWHLPDLPDWMDLHGGAAREALAACWVDQAAARPPSRICMQRRAHAQSAPCMRYRHQIQERWQSG